MTYISLARKYRPQTFADMVGQEGTTLALSNAIRLHREPHGVIFTGVRGVGKTTSARIYAKALNCEQGPSVEPCNTCQSCQAINLGCHEDVLEIDGASHTGVDDVRALQETLSYVPQRSTFKVYIIDEVHMLSASAFNALLKTLEEPPAHVLFVFATTELHKVPETIQSRCQIFHLQKISRAMIAERMTAILQTEAIAYEEAAVQLIAREGRGSMRDALTLLDQAIAMGDGQVSLSALRGVLGSDRQNQPVFDLLAALIHKQAAAILQVIAQWDQDGQAMSSLVEETAKACRNAFILRELREEQIDLKILEMEKSEQDHLRQLARAASHLDLNRIFRQLNHCLEDLKYAELDRCVVENYCLEWCLDPGMPDFSQLLPMLAKPLASTPQAKPVAPPLGALSQPSVPQPSPVTSNLRERLKGASPKIPSPERKDVSATPEGLPQPSPPPEAKAMGNAEERFDLRHKPNPPVVQVPREPAPLPLTQAVAAVEAKPIAEAQLAKPVPIPKQEPIPEVSPKPPSEERFPKDWRALVDLWKKQKPLQARILEEAYLVSYDRQRIRLAVEPQSMAAGKLLQADVRKKMQELFRELFDFQGLLEVTAKEGEKSGAAHLPSADPVMVPAMENLLAVKQREKESARDALKQRIEEHPVTKELISRFGGTIEHIDWQ